MLKQELLVFAQQRKVQFEDGEPFHFHSLANTEQATALVEAAEKEVNDIRDEVSYTEDSTVVIILKATHAMLLCFVDRFYAVHT